MTLDAGGALAIVASIAVAGGAGSFARTVRPRLAVFAGAVVLVAFPLTMRPLPAPLPLAFWLVAAFLGTYLLLAAARSGPRSLAPLPLGGSAEAAFGLLGLLLGYLVAPISGSQAAAPPLASGLALGFVALPAALLAHDALRTGTAAAMTAVAAAFIATGLRGTPPDVVLVALALLVVGAAAGTGVLVVPEHPAQEPGPRGGARRTARAGRGET